MATASELQRPSKSLVDHPQRLGILPTWWFWNDRENWRHVRWFFAGLVVLMSVVLVFVQLHPLVAGTIAGLSMLLALGTLEKYVRRQVLERRQLAAAGPATRSALDEAASDHKDPQ
ncbi:MAG: hypothetical protein R6X02_10455 [Enhygromyxa sp.]